MKKLQEVWVVEYSHKYGNDINVCISEEIADNVVLSFMEENFSEFMGLSSLKRKLKRAMNKNDISKAILLWEEWTDRTESFSIYKNPLLKVKP